MVRAMVSEDVLYGLRSVVKHEPLHEVMVVVLLLVDLDKAGNEAGPVVGRCDDGDEHWCFVWAALRRLKFRSNPAESLYREWYWQRRLCTKQTREFYRLN